MFFDDIQKSPASGNFVVQSMSAAASVGLYVPRACLRVGVRTAWFLDRADDGRHQLVDLHTSDVLSSHRDHLDQLVRVAEARNERLDEFPQSTLEVHPLPAAAVLRHRHLAQAHNTVSLPLPGTLCFHPCLQSVCLSLCLLTGLLKNY